jgi:hypothetical protein
MLFKELLEASEVIAEYGASARTVPLIVQCYEVLGIAVTI